MRKRFLAILLLVSVVLCSDGTAVAITWNNPAGGLFDDPGNWDGGAVPGIFDSADFDLLGPYTVNFLATTETAQLDVRGASVVFELEDNTYFVNEVEIDESAGSFGAAGTRSLEVLNGNLVTGNLGAPFRVGGQTLGNAELIVGFGGAVNSQGQFEVGGNNNVFENQVTVTEGGLLSVNQIALIGGTTGQSSASGTVTVTGLGSEFTASSFVIVGGAGTGELNLSNDASLVSIPLNVPNTTATGVIADEAGSTGTVNVSLRAVWADSLGIDVGRGGNGALNISSAGTVNSIGTNTVARLPGSTGNVTVDGVGSSWNVTGDIIIGGTDMNAGGIGTVDVTNGAQIEVGGNIRVRSGSQIGGDASIEASNVNLDSGARLVGTLSVQNGDVFNSGTVAPGFAPGFSPGQISISDSYTQNSDGLLEIEVGGLTPVVNHDLLDVTGNVTLGGRLEVPLQLGPGFPEPGDEITFLQSSSTQDISGQFSSLSSSNLAAVAPGLALRVIYEPSEVKLRFATPQVNTFVPPASGEGNWFDGVLWSEDVPDSTSVVQLTNDSGIPQTVNIEPFGSTDPPPNAFVHELNVSGNTASMTVRVFGDASVSATNSVVVGNNGAVDLTDGGTVTTHCLHIDGGGLLTGNGTLNSDTVLGSVAGAAPATLSPGNSPGVIQQNGDLQVLPNGVVEIEVVSEGGNHDVVNVTGEITYGGTLTVDLSLYAGSMPTPDAGDVPVFEVITSSSRTGTTIFQDVDTVDSNNDPIDMFFAPIYEETSFIVGLYQEGDMDRDGQLEDDDDPAAFALALTDPDAYFLTYFIDGAEAGDFDNDNDLDFDDINGFTDMFPAMSPASLFELISEMADNPRAQHAASILASSNHAVDLVQCGETPVPEPTTVWLLVIGVGMFGTRRGRPGFGPSGVSRKRE